MKQLLVRLLTAIPAPIFKRLAHWHQDLEDVIDEAATNRLCKRPSHLPMFDVDELMLMAERESHRLSGQIAEHLSGASPFLDLIDGGPMPAGMGAVIRSDDPPQPRWNGEPCEAECGTVTVGKSMRPTWWCAKLEGQRHSCVRITQDGQTFFIADEDDLGWLKVINGGGPDQYHASLPVDDPSTFVMGDHFIANPAHRNEEAEWPDVIGATEEAPRRSLQELRSIVEGQLHEAELRMELPHQPVDGWGHSHEQ